MRLPDEHQAVEVESFQYLGGKLGLRPLPGQKFPPSLVLEGNKSLVQDYPIGTRFRVQATLTSRTDGSQYLFTSWQWDVKILGTP